MIYAISYAKGNPFEKYQDFNAWTAKYIAGADRVIKYKEKDIPEEYKVLHSDIFRYKRGAGLWLWKPYIINKTLKDINEGDWLFYSDAGCFFINKISKLTQYAEKNNLDVFLFGLPLLNRQFCKKECFEILGIEDNNENQVVGTYLLIKKTIRSVGIIAEWLSWCENETLISPDKKRIDIAEFPDFYSHREDQSLLTLIAIKHKIAVNPECSNFRMFPYEYCYKEFAYVPLQKKSDYGVVLISHRAEHPIRYLFRYIRMLILCFWGIKYTEKQVLSNPPSFSRNVRNT